MLESISSHLSEKDRKLKLNKEMFDKGLELLRKSGETNRSIFWKHQVLEHPVQLGEVSLQFRMESGANLDKAKQIEMSLEGALYPLVLNRNGNSWELNRNSIVPQIAPSLRTLEGFHEAMSRVLSDISSSKQQSSSA